ncbi:MAG TPA: amino acid ABC transporter permease [Paracoccaceae bacterium]|nr:amino acid ABC transporter permease [Paracoccaceae bacterium]
MKARPEEKPDFPLWLVVVMAAGLWLYVKVLTDPVYALALGKLSKGVGITIFVAIISFALASLFGLLLAVCSLSRFYLVRQGARLYIEVMRGLPIIVLLLYVAFVLSPALVDLWNWMAGKLDASPVRSRDFPYIWRAVIALMLAYGAFLAEIFRAGLQAVDLGQIEAAKALGLNGWQRFRHVVLPQAFRIIFPPYANDFIAMVKDSSLVSVLGVIDVTQLGKVTAAGNFRYFETYNLVALIYLTMTITLSLLLGRLERRLRTRRGDL